MLDERPNYARLGFHNRKVYCIEQINLTYKTMAAERKIIILTYRTKTAELKIIVHRKNNTSKFENDKKLLIFYIYVTHCKKLASLSFGQKLLSLSQS